MAAVDGGTPGTTKDDADGETTSRRRLTLGKVKDGSDVVRTKVADLIRLVAILCAAVLAIGALLIALKANAGNSVVEWFTAAAEWLAGPLDTLFTFEQENGAPHEAKNALVNWGIAAIACLVVGQLVQRVIKP